MQRSVVFALACAALVLPTAAAAAPLPASGAFDLSTDGSPLLSGRADGDQAGFSVAPAGDVNGDGVGDLIVGAPREDVPGRKDAGAVYVVFGPVGQPLTAATLGAKGFRILGPSARSVAGTSVAAVGDVNGDGLADIAVGAPDVRPPYASPDEPKDGRGGAYVVFGKKDGGDVDLASLGAQGITLQSSGPKDVTGAALAGVGDVNGDGVPDLAVGSPGVDAAPDRLDTGAADVVYLPRTAGTLTLGSPETPELRIFGQTGSRAGVALASLGDTDGDGQTDLAVGAPGVLRGADRVGAVHVVRRLGTGGTVDLATPSGDSRALTITGQKDTLFGVSVGAPGDVNGDKRADLLVGAPFAGADPRTRAGAAYLVKLGTTDADVTQLPPSQALRIDGANSGDLLGAVVSGLGDFDHDGTADIVVTSPFSSQLGRDKSGAAYVILNANSRTEPIDASGLGDRGVRIVGPSSGDELYSVSPAGDLDNDKATDLILGAIGKNGSTFTLTGPTPPKPAPVLPPDPGAQEEKDAGCNAPKQIEAIFDDSGSMEDTDGQALRGKAIELLLAKPRNVGKVFGALEFGDTTGPLFPPQAILDPVRDDGVQQKQLDDVIDQSLQADNGSTDYNLAFTAAKAEAPDADARIFLTDGEHNVGKYENGHRGGPPTYVVGLTITKGSEADQRLQRIASETKGKYYRLRSQTRLQPVVNEIDSRLNCDIDTDGFVDEVAGGDTAPTNDVDLDDDTNSVDVDVSWDQDRGSALPEELQLQSRGGKVLATVGSKTLRKVVSGDGRTFHSGGLTLRGNRGDTFTTVRVNGIGRGAKLRVRVRSVKGRLRIHTQVSQSRRRR